MIRNIFLMVGFFVFSLNIVHVSATSKSVPFLDELLETSHQKKIIEEIRAVPKEKWTYEQEIFAQDYHKFEKALIKAGPNPTSLDLGLFSGSDLTLSRFLPYTIEGLSGLVELRFYAHNITQLPAELFNLINLQTLIIECPSFTEIPFNIGNLSSLRRLELEQGKLENVKHIFHLSLETLSLEGNPLQELPDEIGKITTLKRLKLWGTKIGRLPETIGNLNLIELRLPALDKVPTALRSMTILETLVMHSLPKDCPFTLQRSEFLGATVQNLRDFLEYLNKEYQQEQDKLRIICEYLEKIKEETSGVQTPLEEQSEDEEAEE